jgi:hypothetical protein
VTWCPTLSFELFFSVSTFGSTKLSQFPMSSRGSSVEKIQIFTDAFFTEIWDSDFIILSWQGSQMGGASLF